MRLAANAAMAVQMGLRSSAGKYPEGWIAPVRSSPELGRSSRVKRATIGSLQVVIISALFLVLFSATLLVGGHAAIDSLVQAATEQQADPRGPSTVVVTMPDRVFCRHFSFDNVTAQVTEGPVERCNDDTTIARARTQPSGAFAWRNN